MINNRQNGRRRGRGGGQRQGGGGQGQRDSGNRIDSRARGNAAQLLEKYRNMARDAQMSGDRVQTEYYLQFADHYFRVLADQRGRSDDQQPQRIRHRDDFDQFDDLDEMGDEGEPIRAEEQPRVSEEGRQRGNREGGRDGGRDGNRENRRDDSRRDDRAPRAAAPAVAPAPANDADTGESAANEAEEAPRPRRGRRPRAEATPVVSEATDEAPAPFGADRLPPALGTGSDTSAGEDADEAPRPRRRRVRATAEVPTAAE